MFDLFENGPLMDESGADGGGGVAIAEASSDFGGDAPSGDGGEPEVHDAEFVDPENALIPAEKQDDPGQALVKAGERAVANGKLTSTGRAVAEAVGQLSPKLKNDVVQALLTRDYFMQQFPGGKREVAQLRQLAETHGGEQGISDLRSIADQMEQIDTMYAASDPQFIEKITETPEGQASFVGLMGPSLQKFEKLAPEKFGHQMATRFTHLMDTARLPTLFSTQAAIMDRATKALTANNHELAASFLSEIVANHNSIRDVLAQVYDAAAKPPAETSRAANPQLDDRAKQLTQQEQQLRKQQWDFAVQTERKRTFSKAWAELTKGRTLTEEQDANIKGFYELRMNAKLKGWTNSAARFFTNGDKDGYLKEQFAFFQKAIPEALRQAIQQAIPQKPGPKPNTPLKPPTNGVATAPRNGNAIRVAKMPPTGELDQIRTTAEMLHMNTAITKDGRKVQWA